VADKEALLLLAQAWLQCRPMRRLPILCAALALAACSSPPPGGDLAVTVVGDGPLADDLAAEASRATLVTRTAAGDIAPGLATSWRFLDAGDDLILRLAPLRWPDRDGRKGAELSASDVVAALRRGSQATRAVRDAAGLAARGTARAPIARVVELAPRPATPHLLDWLAEPALALVDRRGRAFPGAYALVRDGDAVRLDRRLDAMRPDAKAATIRLDRASAAEALAAFRKGDRQLVLGEGLAGLIDARSAGLGRALRIEPVSGVIGLAVRPQGTLADARLRRALLLAADGAALANRFGQAALTAQNRLWHALPPPADDRALPIDARRARAAALLSEAGYGPETPLTLTLLLPVGAEADLLGRELAGSLAPLGIAIRSVRRPAKGAAPSHDLALSELAVRVPDAAMFIGQWRCGKARPCSAVADNLITQARAAGSDLPARAAAIDQAETALMADPAFIPLLRPVRWALVAGGVSGFVANPLGWHRLGWISRTP
jgi:oligopeptide transport system substrate-binding protein